MKNPVFVIFNILSFCLAYLLSSYFFSTDKQYSISTSKNQNQKNEIILEQRRKQSLNKLAKKKHSKKRENSPGNLDISSFINLNSSGYKLYGQLSALQEARDLLKYFNEPQIINALNELEKNNKDNFSLRILLYKRWTELNPEASVLHIHKTQTGRLDDLLNRCLHQWVKVDHIGVLDLFKKNEKIKNRCFYMSFESVFSKLYTENKSQAIDYLSAAPNQIDAINGIFKTLNSSEDFLNLLDLHSKTEEHQYTDVTIIQRFAEEYPEGSYKWFEDNGHDKKAFKSLFPSWLEKDREKSLKLLLEHSENLQDAYYQMARLSTDPNNLNWLSEQPVSKEKDNALARVANNYNIVDVNLLSQSVSSIQGEDLRKSTAKKVLERLNGRLGLDDWNKLNELLKEN